MLSLPVHKSEKNMYNVLKTVACMTLFVVGYLTATLILSAQSGGGFEITEAVITAGGTTASGGIFEVDGVVGQPLTGESAGAGDVSVTAGFWNYTPMFPTAA